MNCKIIKFNAARQRYEKKCNQNKFHSLILKCKFCLHSLRATLQPCQFPSWWPNFKVPLNSSNGSINIISKMNFFLLLLSFFLFSWCISFLDCVLKHRRCFSSQHEGTLMWKVRSDENFFLPFDGWRICVSLYVIPSGTEIS